MPACGYAFFKLSAGVLSSLLLAAMGFLPSGLPMRTVALPATVLAVLLLGWCAIYTILLQALSGKELAGGVTGSAFTLLPTGFLSGTPPFGYTVHVAGKYR